MMKTAPLARALAADGTFKLRLIHTGQHYDAQMSGVFLKELGLPEPDHNLGVGSGTHASRYAVTPKDRWQWRQEPASWSEPTPGQSGRAGSAP
jgi:UDP-N-acetylglucosamine 2-epimerase (non-hydrolysing)